MSVHTRTSPPTVHRPARGGLRGVISRAPLIWFFVMATALSWAAWTPYVVAETGLGLVELNIPVLLGSTQLVGVLPGAYLGPITAAFLVTAATDGRAGLRKWAGRLTKWRVGPRWYVAVVVSVPLVLIITTLPLAGGDVRMPSVAVLAAYLPMLAFQMITTGLAEEPGWRDFALPRLQPKYGPLKGTLILGPLWGMWHLPLFFTEWGGWPDIDWVTPVVFVAGAVTVSIVMTWVFNRTGESLPLAMLLHVSINTYVSVAAADMFPSYDWQHGAHTVLLVSSGAAALVILVATRGRLGYRDPAESAAPASGAAPVSGEPAAESGGISSVTR
ncbi:CPBP family intramembrane glutamic endopeptidase [Streptomyces hebeiensis]